MSGPLTFRDEVCPKCGVERMVGTDGYDEHSVLCPTAVDVNPIYPEEMFHLHGKAISGERHSHPLREGESVDDPDHYHSESRAVGKAIYWDHP